MWRESLRRASFRAVPFEVDAADGSLGRRLVEHEYPRRELGYVEDMGRRLRRFTLSAFVLGADYQPRLAALLSALEAEGPGELVHPTLGTMQVSVEGVSFSESTDEQGLARLSISLVEPGELTFPVPEVLPASALATAAAAADASIASGLSLDLSGPAWVEALAVQDLTAAVTQVRGRVFGPAFTVADQAAEVAAALDDLQAELVQLVRTPAALMARWQSVFALLGDWSTLLSVVPPRRQAEPVSPADVQAEANAAALATAIRRSALSAAAAALPSAAFAASAEAESALTSIAAALAPEAEVLGAVRAAAVLYLRRVALGLPGLRTYTPPQVQPTYVVAWDLYGDPRRSEDIDRRNSIAHPGFAVGPLQVLTA